MEGAARDMGERLRHRGPDDADVWVESKCGVALSHRRLAIIDLSEQGHQPMVSADQRFIIVFNGEIYNFVQLRAELEECGHRFRGASDTEVMLAAFCEWGVEAALGRLNGMFAFGAWDRKSEVLWLARDRLGEKPLYFGWIGKSLVFASELKALRAFPGFQGEIDREALTLFFRFNYISSPYSIFSGIHKLLPGSVLRWQRSDGKERIYRYWSLAEVAKAGASHLSGSSPEELMVLLEALLSEAVKLRMVADVPLGAFLSGGVDSSLMVALMQTQSPAPVRTFSIGFDDERLNEADHAKRVAQALGTEHTECYLTENDLLDTVVKIPSIYDEPLADSSQIPTYHLACLARRHVTVSLSGDGPDELFGGYARYVGAHRVAAFSRRIPTGVRSALSSALALATGAGKQSLGKVLPKLWHRYVDEEKIRKLGSLLRNRFDSRLWWDMTSLAGDTDRLLSEPRLPGQFLALLEQEQSVPSDVSKLMLGDGLFYLPEDILAKVDRAAMAVSLETRAPFLDPKIVEFAWTLPVRLKISEGQGKCLLRQLLYRHVPRELVDRPKAGFSMPIARWMRGRLRDWVESSLDEKRLTDSGLLKTRAVRQLWREVLDGHDNRAHLVWGVLVFQGWLAEQSRRC